MKESDSESSKSISESDSETTSNRALTEYEKKRMERIKENKARMEALKLPTLASSLLTPSSKNNKNKKKKGKKNIWKKKDDDEDYQPSDDDEENAISGSEQGEKSEEDDVHTALDSADKGKVKQSLKKFNQKKKPRKLDFKDDDQALQQAIALSLEESLDNSHAVLHERDQKRKKETSDMRIDDNKGRAAVKVETDERKKTRRLNMSSRMQITEDQVIIPFFQFDEAGKGGISLKDLKRVAADHDFSWSDDEIADMIHFFDGGGDGKLNLEDFRKILHRCNMIKE